MKRKVSLLRVQTEDEGAYLKVGELARLTGKTVRALHLLEEMGLLRPGGRSAGGFRLFRPDAIKRVEWIAKLQDLGFTLHEIQSFLRSYEDSPNAPDAMARVREIFTAKLCENKTHIERLQQLSQDLQDSLGYLESCHQCGAPELPDCVGCSRHGHQGVAPVLVAGLHSN